MPRDEVTGRLLACSAGDVRWWCPCWGSDGDCIRSGTRTGPSRGNPTRVCGHVRHCLGNIPTGIRNAGHRRNSQISWSAMHRHNGPPRTKSTTRQRTIVIAYWLVPDSISLHPETQMVSLALPINVTSFGRARLSLFHINSCCVPMRHFFIETTKNSPSGC
jgi:hypothetical protein